MDKNPPMFSEGFYILSATKFIFVILVPSHTETRGSIGMVRPCGDGSSCLHFISHKDDERRKVILLKSPSILDAFKRTPVWTEYQSLDRGKGGGGEDEVGGV